MGDEVGSGSDSGGRTWIGWRRVVAALGALGVVGMSTSKDTSADIIDLRPPSSGCLDSVAEPTTTTDPRPIATSPPTTLADPIDPVTRELPETGRGGGSLAAHAAATVAFGLVVLMTARQRPDLV